MSDRTDVPGPAADPADDESWPIGFMVVIAFAALYVGWRLIQMLLAAIDWMF